MPSPYTTHSQLASPTPDHSQPQVVPGHDDKGAIYGTTYQPGAPTPDYSAPQVVEQPYYDYPQHKAPMSATSYGGVTPVSPQVRPYGFKEHVDSNDAAYQQTSNPPPTSPKDDRKCGMKKRTFFILLICVLIWLVALGVGLGVGLSLGLKKKANDKIDPFCRTNPKYCVGGALNSQYLSKKGAFNGTGIALAGESWDKNQRRIFTIYFQHHTGDIRYMIYTADRTYIGGTKSETVASDAKDASPISAVAYAVNETSYVHIFYVATDNSLKQLTKSNTTDLWESGPLNKLNLKAYDTPTVGLQACWKGNYYGDPDYKTFPTNDGSNNTVEFDNNIGMNIWVPIDDSTFEQYSWYAGKEDWVLIQRWRGFNTHAGVGCYSWGPTSTTYAMLVNQANDVEIHWKDTSNVTKASTDHPINAWVNATGGVIDDVYPTTSLGYTTYFYTQMADRSIKGYDVQYNAENTTSPTDKSFYVTDGAGPVKGLGGTHLTVTAASDTNTDGSTKWSSLYVFYQTEGTDISVFTRGISGGEWTKGELAVPDT
ncbi:hypothetical protein P153DRAFT_282218 [Dothidotthia symphoricarpi CBS 119687]|uniref:Fucose-specific lectin n=1 Tax=Dothidotthia symphoricarpi CBS 119687 TaxID=1392245 RepID=A0A6A6ARR0_9PLEO|nr:uncharacterized protein P153DRAFT_282218 [Dothidotthia symphoricarpi CBS 119687]KAF2133634.1 hypothetical protein P153DRAFT_282218 [Dothidotthia symphoricarpi CBS 119687]